VFLLPAFVTAGWAFLSSFATSFLNSNSSSDADNFTCGTTSALDARMESLLNFA